MDAVNEAGGNDKDSGSEGDDGSDGEEEEEEEESDAEAEDGRGDEEAEEQTGQSDLARHHAEPTAPPDGSSLEPSSSFATLNGGAPAQSSSRHTWSLRPAADTDDGVLSPIDGSRPLSRSPPASRHSSQAQSEAGESDDELAARAAGLSIARQGDIKERAAAEASKQRAQQQRKYHSKRGAQKVGGRHKGSKAKQDTRVKPDRGGFWD